MQNREGVEALLPPCSPTPGELQHRRIFLRAGVEYGSGPLKYGVEDSVSPPPHSLPPTPQEYQTLLLGPPSQSG